MTTVINSPRREITLDLTKGVLVICMVMYHALNGTTGRMLAFEFMAFLPPTFIFITGYLIAARNEGARHTQGNSNRRVYARLISRGLKLVALFTILNVVIRATVSRTIQGQVPSLATLFENSFHIFIVGDGRFCAFEILLPIGYFLVLSPVLLIIERTHRAFLPLLAASGVIVFHVLESSGSPSLNGQMLVVGIIGMIFGRFSFEQLRKASSYLLGFVGIYFLLFIYGLFFGQPFTVQMIETVFALAIIYSLCSDLKWSPALSRLELLGQHSLIAYLSQIAFLQLLARWIGRPDPLSLGFAFLFVTACLSTVLSIEILTALRKRSSGVDGAYKLVFG